MFFAKKLLNGFRQNLDERWVSAQNRPNLLLVQIRIKGRIQEFFLPLYIVRHIGLFVKE